MPALVRVEISQAEGDGKEKILPKIKSKLLTQRKRKEENWRNDGTALTSMLSRRSLTRGSSIHCGTCSSLKKSEKD
jgi:hypothetical protein